MTVEQVTRNIHDLNGRTVTVAGYLGECFGYECVLYADKATEQKSAAFIRELIRAAKQGRKPAVEAFSPFAALGVGSGEYICESRNNANCHFEFDRKAAPFRHSYVMIKGEVTDQCRNESGLGTCLDRSTDLRPHSIRSWKQTGNA